jgi:hypothetical protein
VGEVVGGELGFETVGGFALGGGHDAVGGLVVSLGRCWF